MLSLLTIGNINPSKLSNQEKVGLGKGEEVRGYVTTHTIIICGNCL